MSCASSALWRRSRSISDGHRVAAIARLDDVAEGQPVGFEFLFARIAPQRQQPVLRHRAADRDRAAGGGGIDRRIEHALADARALRGVALHQMAEFVADRGGQLGLVLEQGQQAARDEDVGLDRVRIGDRRIQHDEAEAADAGGRDHALAHPVDIGLQGGDPGRPDRRASRCRAAGRWCRVRSPQPRSMRAAALRRRRARQRHRPTTRPAPEYGEIPRILLGTPRP